MEKEVLGGNIELVGFNSLEPAKIIVVKKIVGNYVKKICDNTPGFEKICLELKENGKKVELITELSVSGKNKNASVEGDNLFFVLDKVFSSVMSE